ncbi:LacI family DNA-binding transcriptional regulator [Desulfoscipio geothermicus]|uniref:Transcriptional regulator, LacI family n=1 Tax=Desulfoscipio geothermicus DSM 3669 TaxID=1121426 RepID=A0A1I6D574_9FIRM|nr:LacI family DNA-binding transcriptional regulator [Desulfoscipio geothermicus]SFR00457.1 transcriptional regulator, LacI family [Desulfoscipio geothermicus DSM 3669]
MGVNIKDIAKAAGVSTATVSRVISGKPGVGEETKKKIKQIIEEMGYRPNLGARGLAKRRTGNIGIVSPRQSNIVLGNPFFISILEGVSHVLDQHDYNMVLSFTLSQQKRLLETHSVDGILLFAARIGDPVLEWLDASKLPTVVIGSYQDENAYPSVRPDDEGGIYQAVKYLIAKGHTRICFVNGPLSSIKSIRCRNGYLKAMEEEKLEVTSEQIIEVPEYDVLVSLKTMNRLFKEGKFQSTAVVCASDYLALGVMKAAISNGIAIPNDLSLIGFGDVPFAELSHPSITTMHTDLKKIGSQAAQMLINEIKGKKIRKRNRVFPMELVERQSVCALKQ